MSIIVCYHSPSRAVIAADGRSTYEDAGGARKRAAGTFPKFTVLPNGVIFMSTGRTSISQRFLRAVPRLVSDYPATTFAELADLLPHMLVKAWAERPPSSLSAQLDGLADGLLGFDPAQGRIRCLWWFSRNNFELLETTREPNSRIAVDGYFEDSDRPFLQELTQSMADADTRPREWIAGKLAGAIAELSRRHPDTVDPACHFASLGRCGPVALSKEFPLPTFEEPEKSSASASAMTCTTIDVAGFNLIVPGQPNIPIGSGAVTGLQYNTLYYVFFDDPGFVGGSFVFGASTDRSDALKQAGRVFVGSITTPFSGGPDTAGNNDGGAGAQVGGTSHISMAVATPSTSGTGSVTNPNAAIDGTQSSFAALASGSSGGGGLLMSGSPGMGSSFFPYKKVIAKAIIAIPVNAALSGVNVVQVQLQYPDGSGGFATSNMYAANAGTTQLTPIIVSAPGVPLQGFNPSQISISAAVHSSTGNVECDVYDAWLEATQ